MDGHLARVFSSRVLPVALLALLSLLAFFQYRWTGEISAAERARTRASLDASLRGFSGDVEAEVSGLFRAFASPRVSSEQSSLEQRLANAMRAWEEQSSEPGLVDGIYVLSLSRRRRNDLRRLNPDGRLVETSWPDELVALQSRLDQLDSPVMRRRGPGRVPPLIASEPPVIAVPIANFNGGDGLDMQIEDVAFISLSVSYFAHDLLPRLTAAYFDHDGVLDYDLVVLDSLARPVYQTPDADVDAVLDAPDARAPLFFGRGFGARRPPQGPSSRRGRFNRLPRPRRADRRPARPEPRDRHDPESFSRERNEPGREPPGRSWHVYVRHRAGSLDAAVRRARYRNLAISFGIMGLLAASVVLMTVSSRRATELSDRKMEFVAGVSHELRTPLAVIRSAGQNLAVGSVFEPSHVKRYGTLVETEGRRLNDLVDQVLQLAGIQSQRQARPKTTLDVGQLVDQAIEDCSSLSAGEVQIEKSIPSPAPRLVGEADALRRAVHNLVANAIKHGGGSDVTVAVETDASDQVLIHVSDEGPGIAARDKPHLFEAFFRGSPAVKNQIAGSGLGLSLVDHIVREHGGRVEVSSEPGAGSRFTIVLPAGSSSELPGESESG